MVDFEGGIELTSYWFPTRFSGERSFLMRLEFSLNQRGKMEYSVAEEAWRAGDLDSALSVVPSITPRDTIQKMRHLLQPWPEGRYSEAYNRSGGILNLFTPPWGEEQDEVWAEMLTEWEATCFSAEDERQAARRELEQQWNNTPHPFFARLTPAQVMMGGGEREATLAQEFLQHLADLLEGQPFESEGQALVRTLTLLRGWQYRPQLGGETPVDIILAERDELLARRARALRAHAEGQA